MNVIHRDLKNPKVIKLKGLMFGLIGLVSAGLLIAQNLNWRTVALLSIAIWAWCRFYYFLFYVLEHYAGSERPYAGVFDALRSIFQKTTNMSDD